jgi:hypothetical protein
LTRPAFGGIKTTPFFTVYAKDHTWSQTMYDRGNNSMIHWYKIITPNELLQQSEEPKP